MDQRLIAELMLDIERSMQMRMILHEKLRRQEPLDLVYEWNLIEQLDLEIARKIRKRPIG
jgi:hypothetical protein